MEASPGVASIVMAKVPDVSDAAKKFRAEAERARRVGDNLNSVDRANLHRYAAELDGKAAEAGAVAPQQPVESQPEKPVEVAAAQPVEVTPEAPAELPGNQPPGAVTKST